MKKNGFTLLEILIVVGIIGLLSVFLVPRFFSSQDKAKEAAVKSVMHSVQLAIEAYGMENMSYPVAANTNMRQLTDNYLLAGEYLSSVPQNPFTGQEYKDSEVAGKILYDYNEVTGKYTLKGYKRNGRTQILELSNM